MKYAVKCITASYHNGYGCEEKTERGWEGWCKSTITNDINEAFEKYKMWKDYSDVKYIVEEKNN